MVWVFLASRGMDTSVQQRKGVRPQLTQGVENQVLGLHSLLPVSKSRKCATCILTNLRQQSRYRRGESSASASSSEGSQLEPNPSSYS